MDNDDWEEDERIERKDLRKMEKKTRRRDHNSRRSQKRAGADDASRRGRTRGATIVQPNLEGHVADLRPASTSVDGEDVTSFGRVGAVGGVLFTWGGEIYDVDKKWRLRLGCVRRDFSKLGSGRASGEEEGKIN